MIVTSGDLPPSDAEALVPGDNSELRDRAERLKLAVSEAGGPTAVARHLQMHLGTLNNYLGGRDMKASALVALARGTGVTLEWLATGEGPMKPGQHENPPETAPQRPLSLWRDTHMDTLIAAYRSAVQTLIAADRDETDAAAVMRITALLYDQLTGVDAK